MKLIYVFLTAWGVRSRLTGTLLNVLADPVCEENTLAHCVHLSVFSHSIVDVHVLQSGQYQFSRLIYFVIFRVFHELYYHSIHV